jgi:hypothetical protein
MDFLRHVVMEGVRLDLKKLEVIKDWKRPVIVKGI